MPNPIAHLLDQADALLQTPADVKKLEQTILQWAVMGKLVEQDENDQVVDLSSSNFIQQKDRLIQQRKLRPRNIAERDDIQELQFNIPENWIWTRFSDVVFFQEGPGIRNWQFRNEGIKLLNVQNILSNGSLQISNTNKFVSKDEFEQKYSHFQVKEGDLLFAASGGSWGKTAWFENPGYPVMLNTSIIRMRFFSSEFSSTFLSKFVSTDFFVAQMTKQLVGMQPNFGSTHLSRIYIPLPPLAEQKRIVAKVDELFTHTRALSARLERMAATRTQWQGAMLTQLQSAPNVAATQTAWQSIQAHFDQLHTDPTHITALKQTILQLAVTGRLVPQDPSDEPASVLLERIAETRKEQGLKKNRTEILEISNNHWLWIKLGFVVVKMDAGWSPKCETQPAVEDEWGVLKTTAVQVMQFQSQHNKKLPNTLTPRPNYQVDIDDILITRAGPKHRVGIACAVDYSAPKLMLSDKIIRFRLLQGFYDSGFIAMCLNTGYSKSSIEENKSGMAKSQMNISQAKLKLTPIPVLGLAEQKRIVAKVEALFALCDQLAAGLTSANATRIRLLDALLQQATG